MKHETTRKGGGAKRGPFEGKRKTFATRITEETREWLEKRAEANDRSISQEAEMILTEARALDERFGDQQTQSILQRLAAIAAQIEERRGGKWHQNKWTASLVRTAWNNYIKREVQAESGEETRQIQDVTDRIKETIDRLPKRPVPKIANAEAPYGNALAAALAHRPTRGLLSPYLEDPPVADDRKESGLIEVPPEEYEQAVDAYNEAVERTKDEIIGHIEALRSIGADVAFAKEVVTGEAPDSTFVDNMMRDWSATMDQAQISPEARQSGQSHLRSPPPEERDDGQDV